MRDTTNDIWNDNDGEEEETPRKRGRFRRFGIFFLILAAVLAVVIVAAYRDGTGFDALKRLFSYGGGSEVTEETGYHYDASDSNRFAVLGDSLVVLSDTKLQVLGQNGEELWSACGADERRPPWRRAAAGPWPMTWAARSCMWWTRRERCSPSPRRRTHPYHLRPAERGRLAGGDHGAAGLQGRRHRLQQPGGRRYSPSPRRTGSSWTPG